MKCCRILVENLDISTEKLGLKLFIFQQDNDPKHTSKLVRKYFVNNKINKLVWFLQSPDLNPIENLCAYIMVEIRKFEK
jgi:hypothetical protein